MDVNEEVKRVISKSLNIPIEQLTDSSKLEDFGAESVDIIELLFELEEKFDIDISRRAGKTASAPDRGKDYNQLSEIAFMTVGDIASTVKQLVDAKAS